MKSLILVLFFLLGIVPDDIVVNNSKGDFKYPFHPIKEIPADYLKPASQEGKVVRIDYLTKSYDSLNKKISKYAYVYLPYGYDKKTKHDIFYLLHGGGGNAERYFEGLGKSSNFKRLLDHMIQNKEIEPLIVVTPSFYPNDKKDTSIPAANLATKKFHYEVTNDLIPAVEKAYSTFAEDVNKEKLEASRAHRAFGGFSMGSVATWYSLIYCLDYFKYFMPMSGDSWIIAQQGGLSHSKETAEYLSNAVNKSGYGANDFFIAAFTGTNDIAYKPMMGQIGAMKSSAIFNFGDKGNIDFNILDGGTHSYESVHRYIYNALPVFFEK